MRIIIETDDPSASVAPGEAQATQQAPAELAARAAAIGAIDAGPAPAAPGAPGVPPLPAVPLGAQSIVPGSAAGVDAGASPGAPVAAPYVEDEGA
jgi:hypothetical protein